MKQFRFDCMGNDPIFLHRERKPEEIGHPEEVMRNLGFHVIQGVPQPICDSWFFLCDKYPDEYPEYIDEIKDYPFDE